MNASTTDPVPLLDLALDAARRASELLVSGRPADLGVAATKSSPTDVVTEMDRASERLITEHLLGVRPDDGILGEEGADRVGRSGLRWVVDPVDGTVNYLYGLPGWAVSIAAEVDGEVVAGVVVVPSQGETFTAVRGGGARLNGRPITCNTGVGPEAALVGTGFGYTADLRARQAAILREVLPRIRDIRRGGSAAVDLCSVACGRLDAYYEQGPQYWDFAAGGLIAREAGARVAGASGAPPGPELVMAAAPELFVPLHDLWVSALASPDSPDHRPGGPVGGGF